jgi:hypothetical protein
MSSSRFLSPAEDEMTELFYESRSDGLGNDFLDDVQRAIDRSSEYPYSGEPVDSNFRRTLLHRFPFSLIYALERESLVIIAPRSSNNASTF